jgi:small-conductance mechanosensitive channel
VISIVAKGWDVMICIAAFWYVRIAVLLILVLVLAGLVIILLLVLGWSRIRRGSLISHGGSWKRYGLKTESVFTGDLNVELVI